ncbi:MAG: alpha/beta fold hydrolase [Gammaproteobacteria bacterium]|nr:alpha/beta fold hydrolase [Gammaproteobacteria bacterium]
MEINQYKSSIVKLDQFKLSDKLVFNDAVASYTLYGDLKNGKKIALFFHGFSSDSEMHIWWKKFPLQKVIENYNILCINSLGSCHGSLGPETINPDTKLPYSTNFPDISISDTVNFIVLTLKKMNIEKIDLAFGCSMGGMQVLDMFIRFPSIADKYISVCASPLPHLTKLMNAAQSNILEDGINKNLSINDLKARMGLARFFFRISCTTENALSILHNDQTKNNPDKKDFLEKYFIADSLNYETCFSPFSYKLYMKMLTNFELKIPDEIDSNVYENKELLLVSINDDQFTPPESIENVYNFLRKEKINVRKNQFNTNYGHEAWILDGERFYEFIEDELIA